MTLINLIILRVKYLLKIVKPDYNTKIVKKKEPELPPPIPTKEQDLPPPIPIIPPPDTSKS